MRINRTAIAGMGAAGLLLAALSVASPAMAATATVTELTLSSTKINLPDGQSKSGTVTMTAKSVAVGDGADVTEATYVFRRDGYGIIGDSVTGLGCGSHTFSATLSATDKYASSVGTATVEVTGSECDTSPVPPPPPPVDTPKPSDSDEPGDKPEPVYYASCWDVRAAGKAPIKPGQPGFRAELDWDHNGVGCDEDDAKPEPKPEPTTPTATVTTTTTATATATVTPTTEPADCTSCSASCSVSCTGCGRCGARAAHLAFAPAPDVYIETEQTQPTVVYYVATSGASTTSSTGTKTTTGTPAFTG